MFGVCPSSTDVEQQLLQYRGTWISEYVTASGSIIISQMNSYIYIYIYHVSSTMYLETGVSV